MSSGFQGLVAREGVLSWDQCQHASLGKEDVKIRIQAAGLNRADLAQLAGRYNPPPGATEVFGLECSGEILAVGEEVIGWAPGQKVCALLAGGGLATEVVCDYRQLMPIPEGVSVTEAAAFPEVFATAWLNLFQLGNLRAGEKVLLMAGASGVGTAAIQLCHHVGAEVFVVAGSSDKLELCCELGASGGINRHEDDWADLKAFGPFNLVLDCCGGDWLERHISLMAQDARLVHIAFMDGRFGQLDFGQLLMKRLKLMGSTLRALPVARKQAILDELVENVWPAIGAGEIKPVIDQVFPVDQFQEAYDYLASNKTKGKVLLTLP